MTCRYFIASLEAGVNREAIDHLIVEERLKTIEHFVLNPSDRMRDNLEMAIRAVISFHNEFPNSHKKTGEGTILVFVSGKSEINAFIDILTNLQNRGFTANLYPYAFHADLSHKDKEMLTQFRIKRFGSEAESNDAKEDASKCCTEQELAKRRSLAAYSRETRLFTVGSENCHCCDQCSRDRSHI